MPFTLPTPHTNDSGEFPFVGVQLVTNPRFDENTVGAQVVLRLTPYRVVDGVVEVAADGHRSFVFGDAYQQAATDPPLAAALTSIAAAIQTFINARA